VAAGLQGWELGYTATSEALYSATSEAEGPAPRCIASQFATAICLERAPAPSQSHRPHHQRNHRRRAHAIPALLNPARKER
jgi:hypothetical protein